MLYGILIHWFSVMILAVSIMASAPLCWNVYGAKETKYDWQPPDFVPQKIYFVQINTDYYFRHAQCFTAGFTARGDTFAILPSLILAPELAPVFSFLESHPINVHRATLLAVGFTTTLHTLGGGIPDALHNITLNVMARMQ